MASGAAKRYAQAVLELARERGSFDAWQADLARLGQLMSDSSAAYYLTSPNVGSQRKRALIDQVLAGAQPEAKNLARLLLDSGRLTDAPAIAEMYNARLLAERGIAIADVTTAEPLTADAEAALRRRLEEIVGKKIEIRSHVDPEIIGGLVARVGDQLIDGSVISQLRRLRARLATTG